MDMTAEEFNTNFDVGTPVLYWPVALPGGGFAPECMRSRTRSLAWTLGDGHPVVKIEKKTGGVSLRHLSIDFLTPLDPPIPQLNVTPVETGVNWDVIPCSKYGAPMGIPRFLCRIRQEKVPDIGADCRKCEYWRGEKP